MVTRRQAVILVTAAMCIAAGLLIRSLFRDVSVEDPHDGKRQRSAHSEANTKPGNSKEGFGALVSADVHLRHSAGPGPTALAFFRVADGKSVPHVDVYAPDGQIITTASPEGRALLRQADQYTYVICVGDGYVAAKVDLPQSRLGSTINVMLDEGRRLSGSVVDQDSHPLEGVEVTLRPINYVSAEPKVRVNAGLEVVPADVDAMYVCRSERTDHAGRFNMGELQETLLVASTHKPGYVGTLVKIAAGGSKHIELMMQRVYVAALQVRDHDGGKLKPHQQAALAVDYGYPRGTKPLLISQEIIVKPAVEEVLQEEDVSSFFALAKRGSRLESGSSPTADYVLEWYGEVVRRGSLHFVPLDELALGHVQRVSLPELTKPMGWLYVRCPHPVVLMSTEGGVRTKPKQIEGNVQRFQVAAGHYDVALRGVRPFVRPTVIKERVDIKADAVAHLDLREVRRPPTSKVEVTVQNSMGQPTTKYHMQLRREGGAICGFRGEQMGAAFQVECPPGYYKAVLINDVGGICASTEVRVKEDGSVVGGPVTLRFP